MSLSDPIANFLTSIRNGQSRMLKVIRVSSSSVIDAVLRILFSEGYISGFVEKVGDSGVKFFEVRLKYYNVQAPVINEIVRISKPGKRVYFSAKAMPKFYNGLGMYIISTSQGIVSDSQARKLGIGGEVLCGVF